MNLRRSLSRGLALALLCSIAYAGPMAISGQFEVSPTGAATYTIPLSVPPGTAGIEPKLSLVYNSQAGNGLLGVGWSLSGLSVITRCPRTMAQDGVRGGINFDANDRFCLDGQRLMAVSGSYGADGTEYRTERESFSKVVSYGSAGSGPAWFKVWTKAGQILEYGNTSDSRIEAQGKASARVWALNKLSDTKGNYFTVAYNEDNANGDYSPSRIDYTGNGSVAPANVVRFIYEDRPDATPAYNGGSITRQRQRLLKVELNDPANGREYRFAYGLSNASSRSRLETISHCSTPSGTCTSPLTLSWLGQSTDHSGSAQSLPGGWNFGLPVPYQSIQGDFNGDGRTDFIEVGNASYFSFLSRGDGTFIAASHTFPFGWTFGPPPSQYQLVQGDFNGDGMTDFAEVANDRHYTFLSNGDGSFSGMSATFPSGWDFGRPVQYQLIQGDFNGDGRTDFVEVGNASYFSFLSTGDGTFIAASHTFPFGWTFGPPPSQYQLIQGDFNGDGMTDFAEVGRDAHYTFLSNGDGSFMGTSATFPGGWDFGLPVQYQLVQGDFNGDGKADFVEVGNTTYYSFLSKGDGTFEGTAHTFPFGWGFGPLPVQYQRINGDFNGDGKGDFLEVGSTTYYRLLSVGDGTFIGTSHQFPGDWMFGHPVQYQLIQGDFNGDGKSDFVEFGGDRHYTFLSGEVPTDILETADAGLGATTRFGYAPLTKAAIYTKGSGATYPQLDIAAPIHVTTSARSLDGTVHEFRYGGLRYDLSGRGLLGFAWTEATNPVTGLATRTEYRQDWPYVGLPSLVKKTASSGGSTGLLSQTAYTYACLNPQLGSACSIAAGNRYFPYVSQSVESGWDLSGAALPTVTTTNQFDAYGNATQVAVSTSDGYSKTTSNTYQNDTSNWFLGRLAGSQVQSVAP